MKRIDIVNAKLKKLYDILFNVANIQNNKMNSEELEEIKNEIRKYEHEKNSLYLKESNKLLKEMPWLMENDTYKKIVKQNMEFDYLFLLLIRKCPSIVIDMDILISVINFIDGGTNKIARIRELLTFNRNVWLDKKLLKKINDSSYLQIKEIFKSITLMSNPKFREYLASFYIEEGKNYDNVRLMERALKEGLDLELVMALGSLRHAREYFHKNMSKKLLDHIASAKTKTLKKQILAIMFNCDNDKILNILARYFEIEVIREQLLDENSFYYNWLIKPLKKGVSHREYPSLDSIDMNQKFTDMKVSKELLDQVAKSKTKTLKKHMLKVIFNCSNEVILETLVSFFDIEEVREQLLDENSFYYKLLINSLKRDITLEEYASVKEVINTSSKGFDNYILTCDNIDILAHSFDCITGPYIYYFSDGKIHRSSVSKFTKSFTNKIDKFHEVLNFINMLPRGNEQDYLIAKYEGYLNDDLKEVARMAILDNEDIELSELELNEWNEYINTIYSNSMDELENEVDVVIGYGLNSFDECESVNLNYSYCWTINPSKSMMH